MAKLSKVGRHVRQKGKKESPEMSNQEIREEISALKERVAALEQGYVKRN